MVQISGTCCWGWLTGSQWQCSMSLTLRRVTSSPVLMRWKCLPVFLDSLSVVSSIFFFKRNVYLSAVVCPLAYIRTILGSWFFPYSVRSGVTRLTKQVLWPSEPSNSSISSLLELMSKTASFLYPPTKTSQFWWPRCLKNKVKMNRLRWLRICYKLKDTSAQLHFCFYLWQQMKAVLSFISDSKNSLEPGVGGTCL